MYQDNLSAMIHEKNCRLSSGNRTKHLCVRYFLIKGRIWMRGLKIKYFLMGKFLAGHFTTSLQGAAFQNFRAEIQGIPEYIPDTDLVWDRPKDTFIPISNDCVENIDGSTDINTSGSW